MFGEPEIYAAVYLHDPGRRVEVAAADLGALFGLTDAETRVAADVARGMSPQDIAAEAGVSVETVRKQLKAIYQKTGMQRQAALAHLVLTSPARRLA